MCLYIIVELTVWLAELWILGNYFALSIAAVRMIMRRVMILCGMHFLFFS